MDKYGVTPTATKVFHDLPSTEEDDEEDVEAAMGDGVGVNASSKRLLLGHDARQRPMT